ncbi:hypothetical protein I350_06506 [Cryptococcus amylolentus CBS 6273]|uniref:Uncharacterized protein n=1 Tax=Cryptococcus amylolentus CBS 6273 TaxID=1296118 RepID=A0A1E3JLF0_9TREE|nr:hypothetical protein I350_06506 [Cryptococcus amylolentus CBS 6273]
MHRKSKESERMMLCIDSLSPDGVRSLTKDGEERMAGERLSERLDPCEGAVLFRYNMDMELGGDGWSDDLSFAISDVTVAADPESVQMVLGNIFYPATTGPRHCHCCASFVPQGDDELWKYHHSQRMGVVFDTVSKELVDERISRY